ncbi:Uncharacterised protein [Vibrio vulnificus]|nr:Uncharacterised protein [Vibrio vulnificus]
MTALAVTLKKLVTHQKQHDIHREYFVVYYPHDHSTF